LVLRRDIRQTHAIGFNGRRFRLQIITYGGYFFLTKINQRACISQYPMPNAI
jgi:hypothetical protein